MGKAFALSLLLLPALVAGCGKKEDPTIEGKPLSTWLEWADDSAVASRRRAVVVFGTAGKYADQVVPPLIKALTDVDAAVRIRATESLIKVGEPSVAPLKKLVADPEIKLRVAAAVVLARLVPSDEKLVPVLLEAAQIPFEGGPHGENLATLENLAQDSLIGMKGHAAKGLAAGLKHGNNNVRILAGRSLLEMSPDDVKEAIPAMEEACKDRYEPLSDMMRRGIHRFRSDGRKEPERPGHHP